MNKSFILTTFLASLFTFGCATFKAQNCTENAGYEKGMNDAKMGRLMYMGQFATLCSGEDVKLAQKGYREGYEAGKKNMGPPQMNLTFKKGKVGIVGAYTCRISNQGQNFTDQAATESDARYGVLDKCRKKFPTCSENLISCSN